MAARPVLETEGIPGRQDMASALRFASAFEELQGQLLALIWELIAKPNAAAKMCAAELAGAIAPCLSLSLVCCLLSSHTCHRYIMLSLPNRHLDDN